MKRKFIALILSLIAMATLLSGCNASAASRAKERIEKIPVAADNLVLYGDKYVTIGQTDYFLPSLAKKLIKGRKPDLYQNTTLYGSRAALYTVVYDRNNSKREEEGCSLALFRFDYQTRKAALLYDMKGTFPVQSYDMATPTVLQYFDEEKGRCVLVQNGVLEILSTQTGEVIFSQQMFGAKDFFHESSSPFARRGADMVCAFYAETVKYYRYAGDRYEEFSFTDEAFKSLRAGQFGTVDGVLYAQSGDEIVFAAQIETGTACDKSEIAALVAKKEEEDALLREQGTAFEQGEVTYHVKKNEGMIEVTSDTGATFSLDAAYLSEHSPEMREIQRIYEEEFPDKTLHFGVDFVVSENRLFISTDAEIQGFGLVALYTPVLVFELDFAEDKIYWQGMHGGARLGGVRFL